MLGKEGVLFAEKSERGTHRGTHKENTCTKPLAGKMRVSDFHEFLKPKRLEEWGFKGWWAWLGEKSVSAALVLERRQTNNLRAD